MRVKFLKGKQRMFLKQVLINLNCPSLKAFMQFGFDVPYSTLKNYYSEQRLLPYDLFQDICFLAKIDEGKLKVILLEQSWGQSKGGKKIKKIKKYFKN